MEDDIIKQIQHEVHVGVAAMQQGFKEDAGFHFLTALQCLESVEDIKKRRDLQSEFSRIALKFGFEDLALMAVMDAIEADQHLDLPRSFAVDMMTYANIHMKLENLKEADANYRYLLKYCLEKEQYANAASASTNLAGILAEEGYYEDATRLLMNSLDYLKKEKLPDTEFQTFLTLIQVLEINKADPEQVFKAVRNMLDQFMNIIPPQILHVITESVESALMRCQQENPGINPAKWKKSKFPELF